MFESLEDQFLLCVSHCRRADGKDDFFRPQCRIAKVRRQIRLFDPVAFGEDDGALDNVSQFPDVSRPRVDLEQSHGLVRNALDTDVVLAVEFSDEVLNQKRNVVRPVAKRGKRNRNHVQPVEEIFAKLSFFDSSHRIAVRGRNHTDIELEFVIAAMPAHAPVTENAEQLRLQRLGHLGDLIDEESSAIGLLETPLPRGNGSGECASLVAEELALNQRFGDCRSVDCHEGLGLALAQPVNAERGHFFTSAALAREHYRHVAPGNALDQLEDVAHGFAGTHKITKTAFGLDADVQALGLAAEFQLSFSVIEQGFQPYMIRQRFGKKIPRTLFHGFNGHVDAALSGNKQHRPVWVTCLESSQKFEAGNLRHHDIGDDDVRILALNDAGGLSRITCLKHLESPVLEKQRERRSDSRVVIDD